jgi:hypothetical protein
LNRRYQRTATTITSGGNRKPANADFGGSHGRGRIGAFTAQVCLNLANAQRNEAPAAPSPEAGGHAEIRIADQGFDYCQSML